MEIIYKNAVIIDDGKKFKGNVFVKDGVIKNVFMGKLPREAKNAKIIDVKDNYLTTPFIDTHIHGSGGFGTDTVSKSSLLDLSIYLGKLGVYAFCPTFYTAPFKKTLNDLSKFAETIGKEKGAKIIGFHLEGPFISKDKLGAMRAKDVQEITLTKVKQLYAAAQGKIARITVAPEVKNLKVLAKFAKEKHIILQAGHTNAKYADIVRGVKLGITHATHLYNAMSPLNHRELGTVGAVFYLKDYSAEIIADGVHSVPEAVKLFLAQKTPDKVFVITDALTPTGKKEGIANGEPVILKGGVFRRKEDNVISGSALTMLKAIQNLVKWGYPLELALQAASQNPAKAHGIKLGIKKNYQANIICLDKKTLKLVDLF